MKNIKIDAKLVRGANIAKAKHDVRYYLEGILLAANGDIVGTDGHTLFITKTDGDTPEVDTIVRINGTVGKSVDYLVFNKYQKDKYGIIKCFKSNGVELPPLTFSIIDGQFPDYERITKKKGKKTKIDEIGLNLDYVKRAGDIYRDRFGCKFEFYGGSENVVITSTASDWPEGTKYIVMPTRL